MLVRRALAVPAFNPDMIDTASGMTLLMWAATYGQDEVVKLLIRRGAGVNTEEKRNSMTALIHAAEQVRRNRDCARALTKGIMDFKQRRWRQRKRRLKNEIVSSQTLSRLFGPA